MRDGFCSIRKEWKGGCGCCGGGAEGAGVVVGVAEVIYLSFLGLGVMLWEGGVTLFCTFYNTMNL